MRFIRPQNIVRIHKSRYERC